MIISEASGKTDDNSELKRRISSVKSIRYLNGAIRRSQVDNIDYAYSHVKTKFILHFEEDWMVLRHGFISRSISVLEKFPNVSVVSLHAPGQNEFQEVDDVFEAASKHSTLPLGVALMGLGVAHGGWGHFTWGAGLRRLSDYQAIGASYSQYNSSHWKSNTELQNEARGVGVHIKKHFIHREWKINWLYRSFGFRVAMFNDSRVGNAYALHIEGKIG